MLSLMHLLVENGIPKISHKFLVPGHTFLPCERDFGVINGAKQFAGQVFVPGDWFEVVKTARRKHPFVVVPMSQGDFSPRLPERQRVPHSKEGNRRKREGQLQQSCCVGGDRASEDQGQENTWCSPVIPDAEPCTKVRKTTQAFRSNAIIRPKYDGPVRVDASKEEGSARLAALDSTCTSSLL